MTLSEFTVASKLPIVSRPFRRSRSATKIGLADIHIIIEPNDVQLGFDVELVDGDDDSTTASFVVDIDANNDGNFDATVNSLSVITPDLM